MPFGLWVAVNLVAFVLYSLMRPVPTWSRSMSDGEAAERLAKEKRRKHKKSSKKKRRDRSAAGSEDEAPRKKNKHRFGAVVVVVSWTCGVPLSMPACRRICKPVHCICCLTCCKMASNL